MMGRVTSDMIALIQCSILLNILAFLFFKIVINKSTSSFFAPCILNIVAVVMYCIILHEIEKCNGAIIVGQIMNYIIAWLCCISQADTKVEKGSYNIKEDFKTCVTAYMLMLVVLILTPVFCVVILSMLVYALVLALGRYIKRKRLEAQLM